MPQPKYKSYVKVLEDFLLASQFVFLIITGNDKSNVTRGRIVCVYFWNSEQEILNILLLENTNRNFNVFTTYTFHITDNLFPYIEFMKLAELFFCVFSLAVLVRHFVLYNIQLYPFIIKMQFWTHLIRPLSFINLFCLPHDLGQKLRGLSFCIVFRLATLLSTSDLWRARLIVFLWSVTSI